MSLLAPFPVDATAAISDTIARSLNLAVSQVEAALALFQDGATVPFVARYRKERTGNLDEVQLRHIAERHAYLSDLNRRKATILESIAAQQCLTPDLQAQVLACQHKADLEDLYLPYRPRRRTRATQARDRGLGPLAEAIVQRNRPRAAGPTLETLAAPYCDPQMGITTVAEALQGAADILAEQVAERPDLRRSLRQSITRHGVVTASAPARSPAGGQPRSRQYAHYYDFRQPLKTIASHSLLALLRGEREQALRLKLEVDRDTLVAQAERRVVQATDAAVAGFYRDVVRDGVVRLMLPSLISDVMAEKKIWADGVSIQTFATNLRQLLLAPPAGMKPTLGVDPGFRTGCKVAAVGPTGQFLDYRAVFPHQGESRRQQATTTLQGLIRKHRIELIAIGNGTASRQTEVFVRDAIATLPHPPLVVMVSEAGASVYSASEGAAQEFTDLDVTVRGAISIARRLQDPLAELVKIDPKAIGVGQYQHDVDQKRLKHQLDETVESCVNYVGVNVNTASRELLTYVSGLSATVAGNIVAHRNAHGPFKDRQALRQVKQLGPKAFEQAAGFLRIPDGSNPLDNTAVHPESYPTVEAMAAALAIPPAQLSQAVPRLRQLDLTPFRSAQVGDYTLQDILTELEKPGRDPRRQFTTAQFRAEVQELSDLMPGLVLEGVVTNVTNFGAFVDVGVHQDGLVHISQLADRYVAAPSDVVQVGQVVQVRVLEVDGDRRRISLSLRAAQDEATAG